MSPILKYSLARLGIFLAVAAIMLALPVDISPLLKLMIAVLVSMILAFFILRRLRDEVAVQATGLAQRRAERRERLRAALDGGSESPENGTRDG